MADEETPIIVKKIIKKGGGHHGGAWKVAYADFVTAMMALFMVLWILSQGPETREEIAAYFNDPKGIPIIQSSKSLMDNIGAGMLDAMPNAARVSSGSDEGMGPKYVQALTQEVALESEKLTKVGKKIIRQILSRPELSGVSQMVQVVVTPEGLRIELSDGTNGTFFNLGSSTPKEAMKEVLKEVVFVLEELDNKVAIEGHTDATPYNNGKNGYSNWELSSDRANVVRRLLLEDHFPVDRIAEVRAYADKKPLPGTDPKDGRNRRISILVKSKVNMSQIHNKGDSSRKVISPDQPAPASAMEEEVNPLVDPRLHNDASQPGMPGVPPPGFMENPGAAPLVPETHTPANGDAASHH